MTNSTPRLNSRVERQGSPRMNSTSKLNSKVERQGSPNSSPGKRSQRSSSIKTTTFFPSGTPPRGSPGRVNCSTPASCKSLRSSPVRNESPRGSPTNSFYAGAKFSEPPSPMSLPKPPNHWTGLMNTFHQTDYGFYNMNTHLKMILKIQA